MTSKTTNRSKRLPDEILIHTFSFLDDHLDIVACSAVNTRWNSLINTNKFWKSVCLHHEQKYPKTFSSRYESGLINFLEPEEIESYELSNDVWWRDVFQESWYTHKRCFRVTPHWNGCRYVSCAKKLRAATKPDRGEEGPLECLRDDEYGWGYIGMAPSLQDHPKGDWFTGDPKCPICGKCKLNIIWTCGDISMHSDLVDIELKCLHCCSYFYIEHAESDNYDADWH